MPRWSDENRVKSLISRSAIVTEALEANEGKVGLEAYDELQTLESKAVAAGATYDFARASHHDAQVKRDEAIGVQVYMDTFYLLRFGKRCT